MLFKRAAWMLALIAVLASVLAFPTTQPVAAQDPDLPQVAASDDGVLSVRLPAGWVTQDNTDDPAIALFSTQLWWGDSQAALNSRIQYNRGTAVDVTGLGGGALLVNGSLWQQTFGAAPTSEDVMTVLLDFNADAGGTVETPSEVTVNGNPGFFSIIDTININDERALILTVDTSAGVILVLSSGTSSNVADNAGLLVSIANSIQSPAERGGSGLPGGSGNPTPAPTATASTPGGNGGGNGGGSGQSGTTGLPATPPRAPQASDFDNVRVVGDDQGIFSVEIPSTWGAENHLFEDANAFIFGDSQAAIDSRVADITDGGGASALQGAGGAIIYFTRAEFGVDDPTPSGFALDLMGALEDSYVELGATILLEATEFNVYGIPGAGAFVATSWPSGQTGWTAFIIIEPADAVMLITLTAGNTADFEGVFVEMAGIIDGIEAPANSSALAISPVADLQGGTGDIGSTDIGSTDTGSTDTGSTDTGSTDGGAGSAGGLGDVFGGGDGGSTNATPAAATPVAATTTVFATSTGSYSIELPANWTSQEGAANDGSLGLIVGDSEQAVTSRRDSLNITGRSASVTGTAIMMTPFDLSEFFPDGNIPVGFGAEVLDSLVGDWTQGNGEVIIPTETLTGTPPGVQIALVGGTNTTNGETGFVAIAIFEDANMALFIYATSESSAVFSENSAVLRQAIASVRLPAAN